METVELSGIYYKIIGVWHYSEKAVVLLDMGLCAFIKEKKLGWECTKVVSPLDVPVIGKEVYNLQQKYIRGELTDTQHVIRPGYYRVYGYHMGLREIITLMKKKK